MCGVYCLHIVRVVGCISQGVCVVMAVCDDSACLVLSYCVVGCGMAMCVCFVACLPLLCLPLPLCVGVRGSARAALRARTLSPNTIASPLLLALSCLLFSSLLPLRLSSSSAFPCLEWRCVIHHVSVCLVGMTATGSLSLSSPFFW